MSTAPTIGEITRLMIDTRRGSEDARRQLFAAVYDELRRVARSRLAQESPLTLLNPTSLVNECYLRMFGNLPDQGEGRRVFFGYAAKVMRSIIVDHARDREALKRGGGQERVTLVTDIAGEPLDGEALISVHEAMERLRGIDPRCHDIVELRYFAGLSIAECAELLELSPATISRDWEKARLFLAAELSPD